MSFLCDACSRAVQKRQHRARRNLKTIFGTRNSCPLCSLILDAFALSGHLELISKTTDAGEAASVQLSFHPSSRGAVGLFDILEVTCFLGSRHRNPVIKTAAPIAICAENKLPGKSIWLERTAESSLEGMHRWLQSCNDDHPDCCLQISNIQTLPTRVIDVGNHSCDPYLFVTDGRPGVYAALSHCWGSNRPLTTSIATLESRKRGIALSSLPKTFRDAIFTTRGLGLQYLWIDSLCIVQDDQVDWELESASMATIFQSAYVTLAASSAKDSTIGCYSDKNTTTVAQYSNKNQTHRVYMRPVGLDTRDIENSWLGQRAWALQETLLSRRIIHFARDQMYWQCSMQTESEDATFLKKHTVAEGIWKIKHLDRYRSDRSGKGSTAFRSLLNESWWDIIEDYSGRLLTFGADKLAAFAGVTVFFQERSDDTPLVGLWLEDLAFGLLWDATLKESENASATQRTPEYLKSIPTWSWMNFNGPIIAPSPSLRDATEEIEVVKQTLTWSGQWLSSKILHASITIRARISPVLLTPDESPGMATILKPVMWHRGDENRLTCNQHGLTQLPAVLGDCSLNRHVAFEPDTTSTFGKTHKCPTNISWILQVSVSQEENPEWRSTSWSNVLLLQPCGSNAARNTWLRDIQIVIAESAGHNGGVVDVGAVATRASRGISSFHNIEMGQCDLGEFRRVGMGKINGRWGTTLSSEAPQAPKKIITLI